MTTERELARAFQVGGYFGDAAKAFKKAKASLQEKVDFILKRINKD